MKMKLADHTTAMLPLTPTGTTGALVARAPVIIAALREYFGASINVPGVIYMAALAFAGGFQANAGISGVSWAAFPSIELAVTSIIATVLLLWRYATAGSPAGGRPPSPRGQVKEGFAHETR
jgi:hypothetical protein